MIYLTGVSSAETRAAHRDDLGLLATPDSAVAGQRSHYPAWAADNAMFAAELPDGAPWQDAPLQPPAPHRLARRVGRRPPPPTSHRLTDQPKEPRTMPDTLALFDTGPSPEDARALMDGRPQYPCPVCGAEMARQERRAGKCLRCHNAGHEADRLDLATTNTDQGA